MSTETGRPAGSLAVGTGSDGLEELRTIGRRLLELSGNGFADMEGADLKEFREAEALYAHCHDAAGSVAKCIQQIKEARQNAEVSHMAATPNHEK